MLNLLGLSRGGMAQIMLIQRLTHIPKKFLTINALIFDPVPGNLISSQSMDVFGLTFAAQSLSMKDSPNLARVTALYPHLPLPDVSFHAPIFPHYPSHTEVREMVILGCHQGALFYPTSSLACQMSFLIIKNFMCECGTEFTDQIHGIPVNEQTCLRLMDREMAVDKPTIRYTHANEYTTIVRRSTGDYLNQFHFNLAQANGNPISTASPTWMLDIERDTHNALVFSQ